MIKGKLSLGERIALAASGSQEDDFPEDIEYETSAKVVDLEDDPVDTRKPVRSSLRTKNVQLLDELDTRYAGAKVSRNHLAKSDGLAEVNSNRKAKRNSGKLASKEENIEEYTSSDDDVDVSGSLSKLLADEDESDVGDEEDESDVEEQEDESEVEEEEDDSDVEEEAGEGSRSHSAYAEEEDDEEDAISEQEGAGIDDEESGAEDDSEESESEGNETVGLRTLSLGDKEAEIAKGRATLNQIRIWDSLLEVRIRLQKMLLECNRLPHTDDYDKLLQTIGQAEHGSSTFIVHEKSQDAIKLLMHELIRLQQTMIQKNSETQKAVSSTEENNSESNLNNDPMNEEITSDENEDEPTQKITANITRKRKVDKEAALSVAKKIKPEDFVSITEKAFSGFIPFRNQTIQKWNDKTQFAGGKFNRKPSQQISTLKQIEQILSNKERLLKRTQIKRSNYTQVVENATPDGCDENEEKVDAEIFDDDDFYHQLLRELIERKTSSVNDPIQLSHHWLELQKLRTKLKRKVDTKASKGRKIRYNVHSKLVNFMASRDSCTMSSAAVKELFSSLFGKMSE